MSTKVKGLLKGLRYISHIFENEKEDEMQIGFPTDVKHVAHIGLDGPTVNSPSWMNDFKTAQNSNGEAKTPTTQSPSHDFNQSGAKTEDMPVQKSPEKPKSSRPQSASSNPSSVSSSLRQSGETPKNGRRHHSSGGTTYPPPSQDPASGGGSSRGRRNRSSNHDTDSPDIPKHSNRRKSKGSNSGSGDSTRSSRRSRKSSTDLSDPTGESESVSRSRHGKKKDEMG